MHTRRARDGVGSLDRVTAWPISDAPPDHDHVRLWLLTIPWWAQSLVFGFLWTVLITSTGRFLHDESWTQAMVPAVITGVLVGAAIGLMAARDHRRFRETAGTLSPHRLRQAARLALRGPVPDDLGLRQSARRMALQQREEIVRPRRWALPFFVSVLVLAVWLALTSSPAWPGWVLSAVLVPTLAEQLLLPRRLASRAELLADPAGDR